MPCPRAPAGGTLVVPSQTAVPAARFAVTSGAAGSSRVVGAMRALVVFESMFGNTRSIAAAVAEGLGSLLDVDLVEVGAAPTHLGEDVDLLVVGGPTHAFGMSRPSTREDAAGQATQPLVSRGIGLREWLADLEVGTGVAAATFDTRIDRPRVPGSAARAVAKRLRSRGLRMIAHPECFFVGHTAGPLLEGEEARARRWAEGLAADLSAHGSATRASR